LDSTQNSDDIKFGQKLVNKNNLLNSKIHGTKEKQFDFKKFFDSQKQLVKPKEFKDDNSFLHSDNNYNVKTISKNDSDDIVQLPNKISIRARNESPVDLPILPDPNDKKN